MPEGFLLNTSYITAEQPCFSFLIYSFLIYIPCLASPPSCFLRACSRTQFGLPESEACFLQGSGQRRLRGLAVEKERCKGLLFSEMEEVLVCPEGQLPVLVHQWGGKFFFNFNQHAIPKRCSKWPFPIILCSRGLKQRGKNEIFRCVWFCNLCYVSF